MAARPPEFGEQTEEVLAEFSVGVSRKPSFNTWSKRPA
jgi:hypothetical protein